MLDADALSSLMDEIRRCFANGAAQVADDLPALLDELRGLSFGPSEPAPKKEIFTADDIPALPVFLEMLRAPFDAVESSGAMGHPWSAAALKRDEVRNASVLRWFLDPRGGHGWSDALLVDLLRRVGCHLPDGFPERPSARCSVSVEESPDGDRASRVDIQIDDADFFLVIEVKIKASEQKEQVKRYGDAAATRTLGRRPWAVVFLTPEGRSPTTAGDRINHVVPVSWGHVAAALRRIARTSSEVPRFLAMSFAAHIATF